MKDITSDELKYPNLPKLLLTVLSMPHGNAEDERIFSMVRKNATEFRPSLSTATLSHGMVRKVYTQPAGEPCHQVNFGNSLLQICKKATAVLLERPC